MPDAAEAQVYVLGPMFGQQLTAARVIEGLQPGDYQVSALQVKSGADWYVPATGTSTVTVEADQLASVDVHYSLTAEPQPTGSLQVDISGLPGLPANVQVVNASGFSFGLTGSHVFAELPVGNYEIIAAPVNDGYVQYTSSDLEVELEAGANATISLDYREVRSSIALKVQGLAGIGDAAVTLQGPDGFQELVTATRTFSDLTSGEYTITAAPVEDGELRYRSRDSQTILVTGAASTGVTVEYSVPKVLLLTAWPISANTALSQVAPAANGYDITLIEPASSNQVDVQVAAAAAHAEVEENWYDLLVWFSSGWANESESAVLTEYIAAGGRIIYMVPVDSRASDFYSLLGMQPTLYGEFGSVTFQPGFLLGDSAEAVTLQYGSSRYAQSMRPLDHAESLCNFPVLGVNESCAVLANGGRTLTFGIQPYVFTDDDGYPWIYSNAMEQLLGYPEGLRPALN